ncbi:unnamed protein product, partial [Meganyctiphanes norvegica]
HSLDASECMELQTAVETGDVSKLTKALTAGANATVVLPDLYDGWHCVNLIGVAACKGQAAVIAPLVRAGARLHHRTSGGSNALHIAAYKGHPQVLCELVRLGLDVNTADNWG